MSMSLEKYPPPVEGYPKLACYMGTYPECSIYRRFSSLNSQSLLYFQAELTHLEAKLRRLEAADLASSEETRSKYSKDWFWLNNSAFDGDSEQLHTVYKIRDTLKEYNNAIIQQSTISCLADPNQYDLRSLQNWLERPNMGNLELLGKDRHVWGASNEPITHRMDLLALASNSSEKKDAFWVWFAQKFIHWFHHVLWHRVKKPDEEFGVVLYEDKLLQRYTSQFATIIACLLPILAIIVLYGVTPMHVRLGLMACFTVVFTVCLAVFTNATRGEIFIATSTFAAVMVVFISTGNGVGLGSN